MLSPEDVKPLLLNEDRDVRAKASDYFAQSGTTDTEVLDRCLQAIMKYDYSKVYGFILVANLDKLTAGPSAPFRKASWETNIYASSVLGNIHDQRAEEAILDLLRKVRRREDRVHLCSALADQFAHSGIEVLSKELGKLDAASDPHKADLEGDLLTLSLALKVDIPERLRLLAKRDATDRRLAEVEGSMGLQFPLYPDQIPRDLAPGEWEEEWEDVPASEVTEDMLFPAEPIQAEWRPRLNDR